MSSVIEIQGDHQLLDGLRDSSLRDQGENQSKPETHGLGFGSHGGCCAICLDSIPLQETAMVKDCEHTYCVTCILRWASYKEKPTCPQCKHPFDFLNVHRTLDGSVEDFMFEESVCLLLRASWFEPLFVEEQVLYAHDFPEDYIPCDYGDEDDDDLEDLYFRTSGIRIGNRRWGDNGYVRSGRREARPIPHRPNNSQASGSVSSSSSSSSSREAKGKQVKTTATGRRAKRAMKREAADKAAEAAAAAKHEAHLVRLGRK